MKKGIAWVVLILLVAWQMISSYAIQRFPKPEFESGYITPETLLPNPRAEILEVMDVTVLLLALSVVTWAVLRRRSRNLVFWISVFSLAYFGFYREGCVCSIGAIQNVTLALFTGRYVIPWTVLVFFMAPLLFTLAFGRTFCAGVCPFGAFQDLISWQPRKIGPRLNAVLGVIPYIYLGLAVLYAATGTDFIICRYDPFVGIFRFNATFGMFLFAGALLLSGVIIARPYCRFLCPYGVLLNWISRFSKFHRTITPSVCVQCRLCEESCPYEAIEKPVTVKNPQARQMVVRKFMLIILFIPFFMLLGGWTGAQIHESLALVNGKVQMAEELVHPEKIQGEPESIEMTAFKASGMPVQELYAEASRILRQFYIGGWVLGGFIGLTIGGLIAGRLITRYRTDFEPNRGSCFSCARCVDYCPVKS
ncbi:MAG: 4Fe-4S binding protein [Bacteroidales bacterium]|nr:4Fe-4S binding protein [Bacteroidales bacterium]